MAERRRQAQGANNKTPQSTSSCQFNIASVAIAYVLSQKSVGGVILGARHGRHVKSTCTSVRLRLTESDLSEINSALLGASPKATTDHGEGERVRVSKLGNVYALEREATGRHGRIMRYNLNGVNTDKHRQEFEQRCKAEANPDATLGRNVVESQGHLNFMIDGGRYDQAAMLAEEAKLLEVVDASSQ